MTNIELFTDDQKLYFAKKVYIASGDVDSVQLHVDFDSAWDGFLVRTASFDNTAANVGIDVLMIDNQCTVPFEVLATPGTLYISIIGDSADGTKRKTSGRIKYRIDVGAELSDITLTPAMDIYQQYLAAVKAEADPIFLAMKADFDEYKAALTAEFESMKSHVLKPCNFSNTIHTMTATEEEWTATQDCWASLYLHGYGERYATMYIDNVVAARVNPQTTNGDMYLSNELPPVYVQKGAKIKLVHDCDAGSTESNAKVTIYSCKE